MLHHPGIFEEIMLMIAHGSLEDLDNCRLVCRTWNEMIMYKIWENPTKKWGTIIQRRIQRSWEDRNQNYYPSDEKISRAKLLGNKLSFTLVSSSSSLSTLVSHNFKGGQITRSYLIVILKSS